MDKTSTPTDINDSMSIFLTLVIFLTLFTRSQFPHAVNKAPVTSSSAATSPSSITLIPSYEEFEKYSNEDILKWLEIVGKDIEVDYFQYDCSKVTGKHLLRVGRKMDLLNMYFGNKVSNSRHLALLMSYIDEIRGNYCYF